jgi:16S rRNA G527 N7-methylase RsmG
MLTLQQIINERISFLKALINNNNSHQTTTNNNKAEEEKNKTLQLQIDAIRSIAVDGGEDYSNNYYDIVKVNANIMKKQALLKKTNDVHEFDRLCAEVEALQWLQRQIVRYSWQS